MNLPAQTVLIHCEGMGCELREFLRIASELIQTAWQTATPAVSGFGVSAESALQSAPRAVSNRGGKLGMKLGNVQF